MSIATVTAHNLHIYKDLLLKIKKNHNEIDFIDVEKLLDETTVIW